jgi:uncharacterized iron-regulated membrane protein
MNPLLNTILFVIGCLILIGLAITLVWDYLESRKPNGRTISDRALALWLRRRDQPAFWFALGILIGFAVGFSFGFVCGHLFWPQFVSE